MSLLPLPPEIHELIAQHTPPASLLNLRLASRALESNTFKTFKTAFFTTRRIYLTERDLWFLLKTLEHPEFGPALRRIEICVDEICSSRGLKGLFSRFHGRKARKEQKEMRKTDLDVALLIKVFEETKRRGVKLEEIVLFDNGLPPASYHQQQKKKTGIARRPPKLEDTRPIDILLTALERSSYDGIKILSTRLEAWSIPLRVGDGLSATGLPTLFPTLQNLTLNIHALSKPLGATSYAQSLAHNLATLPNLSFLALHFIAHTALHRDIMSAILTEKRGFRKLKRWRFSNAAFNWDEFVAFLKERKGSRNVEVKGCGFYGRGDWEEWKGLEAGRSLQEALKADVGMEVTGCMICEESL